MTVRRSLTDFEFMILLAILRLNARAYGVMIGRDIEQRGLWTLVRESPEQFEAAHKTRRQRLH